MPSRSRCVPNSLSRTAAAVVLGLLLSACRAAPAPDGCRPGGGSSAPVDDGTPCASGVCSEGICVSPTSTRTVTLRFRTLYRPDDGSETEVEELPLDGAAPSAVLIADGSPEGYATFPVQHTAPSTFAASGVPVGSYFLKLDRPWFTFVPDGSGGLTPVASTRVDLVPLVRGDPDLSTVVAARPDLERVSSATPVTFQIDGMEPFVSGSRLVLVGSQPDFERWPYFMAPRPDAGATSQTLSFDWMTETTELRPPGLPDPARADAVFLYQQAFESTSSPVTGFVRRAARFARLDGMRVENGVPATFAVPLAAAPQTGSIATSVRGDLFTAIAAQVNPDATAPLASIAAVGVPRSATYPDAPDYPLAQLFFLALDSGTTGAFDLGTRTYGRFLEPRWDEYRVVSYAYPVTYATGVRVDGHVDALEPAAWPQAAAAVPVLGPPRTPRINGADAFAFAAGVGTQPVFSWMAPSIGMATSYDVTIGAFLNVQPGDVGEVRVTVHGGTSFLVPPGLLRAGVTYYARVTARSAPWDVPRRAPFRGGVPLYTADCLTAAFQP
jgi:hypothetical protein